MRIEYYLALAIGFSCLVWSFTINGLTWQAFGLFLLVGVSVEWIGSIFLKRHHELTKNDIYDQARLIRERIRRFEE
jgi:hypothetical protein